MGRVVRERRVRRIESPGHHHSVSAIVSSGGQVCGGQVCGGQVCGGQVCRERRFVVRFGEHPPPVTAEGPGPARARPAPAPYRRRASGRARRQRVRTGTSRFPMSGCVISTPDTNPIGSPISAKARHSWWFPRVTIRLAQSERTGWSNSLPATRTASTSASLTQRSSSCPSLPLPDPPVAVPTHPLSARVTKGLVNARRPPVSAGHVVRARA
jgi:hypothetical protein